MVEKSARLAWPVSWKRRSLSVNPTLPGPSEHRIALAVVAGGDHVQPRADLRFIPPFAPVMQRDVQAAVQRLPLYGQRHSPCLMLSRCGATSHGNTASGRSSPFRSPSTRPAAVASACPATPAFPDRRSAFPLQRALRRQAGQIQRNGYLAGEVQRLRAVGRDNGQTLQRQLLFSSSCASALRFGP